MKTLLSDTRAIVELVNDDDVVSDILHHSFDLLRATATGKGYGPRLPVPALIENWRTIAASLFTSAVILDMFSTGSVLVHTFHEADGFLVRLTEVIGLMTELMLSVPTQQEVCTLASSIPHSLYFVFVYFFSYNPVFFAPNIFVMPFN